MGRVPEGLEGGGVRELGLEDPIVHARAPHRVYHANPSGRGGGALIQVNLEGEDRIERRGHRRSCEHVRRPEKRTLRKRVGFHQNRMYGEVVVVALAPLEQLGGLGPVGGLDEGEVPRKRHGQDRDRDDDDDEQMSLHVLVHPQGRPPRDDDRDDGGQEVPCAYRASHARAFPGAWMEAYGSRQHRTLPRTESSGYSY